eukprot:Awhi_evm1s3169
MKNLVLKAFKNLIFSKNDLMAPTNLGGMNMGDLVGRRNATYINLGGMNMVDLVGRRNATYIKHGAHVFNCYYEQHDKSSFCWIYEILESAAHAPSNTDASFIDNRNSELERYIFATAPSAHKIKDLRTQTAYVDVYKPYPISAFKFKPKNDFLQQVLARENSNFLTPRRVIELKSKLRAANFILKPEKLDPNLTNGRFQKSIN